MTDNFMKVLITTIITLGVIYTVGILHKPIEKEVKIVVSEKDKVAFDTQPHTNIAEFMKLAEKRQMRKEKILRILDEAGIEYEQQEHGWYYAYTDYGEYHIGISGNRVYSIWKW